MADCTRIIEMPMMDRVPWTKKAVTNPAIFAKPAIRPDVGTVFAISTPFGPGDITSNDATTIKAAMSVVAISGSAHGDFPRKPSGWNLRRVKPAREGRPARVEKSLGLTRCNGELSAQVKWKDTP